MQESDARDLDLTHDMSANASTLVLPTDAKKGKAEIEVDFGPGENPKHWSLVKGTGQLKRPRR